MAKKMEALTSDKKEQQSTMDHHSQNNISQEDEGVAGLIFDSYYDSDSSSSIEAVESDFDCEFIKRSDYHIDLPKEAIFDPTALDSFSDDGSCVDDHSNRESSGSLSHSATPEPTPSSTDHKKIICDEIDVGLYAAHSFLKSSSTQEPSDENPQMIEETTNQVDQLSRTSLFEPSMCEESGENAPEVIYLPSHLISPPRINRRKDQMIEGSPDRETPSKQRLSDFNMKSYSPASHKTLSTEMSSIFDTSSCLSLDSSRSSSFQDENPSSNLEMQSDHEDFYKGTLELVAENRIDISCDTPFTLSPDYKPEVSSDILGQKLSRPSGDCIQRDFTSDMVESFLPLIDLDLGAGIADGDLFLSILDCPSVKTKASKQTILTDYIHKRSPILRSFRHKSQKKTSKNNNDCGESCSDVTETEMETSNEHESSLKTESPTRSLCCFIVTDAIGQIRNIKTSCAKSSRQIQPEDNSLHALETHHFSAPCTLSYLEYLLDKIDSNFTSNNFFEVAQTLKDLSIMIENNSNIPGSSEMTAVISYNEGLLALFDSMYDEAIIAFENAAIIFDEKNKMKEYVSSILKIGISYFGKEDFASSMIAFKKALGIMSSQPWSCVWSRTVLAETMHNIACTQYMAGNKKESLKSFKESTNIQSSLLKTGIYCDLEDQPSNSKCLALKYSITLCNMGYLQLLLKNMPSLAVKTFEDAIARQQLLIPKNNDLYTSTLEYLAMANLSAGNVEISFKIFNRILEIYISHFGTHHQVCALTLSKIALIGSSRRSRRSFDALFLKKWKDELVHEDGDSRTFSRLVNFVALCKFSKKCDLDSI